MAEPDTITAPSADDSTRDQYRVYEGGKMASQDDLMDAKIAAAEARTDTKIVRLEGKLDLVISKLDLINESYRGVKEGQRAVITNIWVVFAALAAIIIGSIAAAPVIFDLGMRLRETITKEIQERVPAPSTGAVRPPDNR
jgi:hypothetical protein